jgi:hypothetical protein
MKASGVSLWTVEIAFGNRPFMVTDADNPQHLQLRTVDEIWHKEIGLNLLVQRLPTDWENVAVVDADIRFFDVQRNRHVWVDETLHAMQHYEVVQMFQQAIDLGPKGEVIQIHNGFMWSYLTGKPYGKTYTHWHPGYAWCYSRRAWNALGGLIDIAVLGAGDNHMAHALIGRWQDGIHPKAHPDYLNAVRIWGDRAKELKKDVGFVPLTITHEWHGKKADRKYWDRWQILINHQYSPLEDLRRDWQGLYQLTDRDPGLRDDIRAYFRARNEDSIDLG